MIQSGLLLHGLFAAQARRAPQAEALLCGEERLSYAELDARAGALALHLRRLGVTAESLVGLLAERSTDMVTGVLGTLAAGGAYVPLDPGYPAERLAFMWEDVRRGSPPGRPAVLLAQRPLAGVLPGAEEGPVVWLDDFREDFREDFRDDRPGPATGALGGGAGPDNLAYVIYTSGSTGRPKGVLVPHRGAVNVIRESERILGVGPGDRVLQLASLGFDASVLEIFTALATGACLVLTRRETLLSGVALGRELREREITAIAIPPSLLDTVEEDLPALRTIIVGGEACSGATAARWARGRRLVNAYAPTEATIYATAGACDGDGEAPSMGRPIAGMSAWLVDPDGEATAPGSVCETGELCLGGVGVVRGYLNRPELTAERFVPDPFGAEGSRLYRSGDLARQLPDGSLAFAGRVDTQVKVRGHRIELGEIEAVLGEMPEVQTAAVLALGEGGDKRLVGYVVRRGLPGDNTIGASVLRERLGRKLPGYMVPGVFVFLEAMPATPTGKIDRRALPAPGRGRPELSTELVLPRTPLEEELAHLWGELLGVDQIGVRDNLFELGGHSLVAAQIVARVRAGRGVELPLRDVFEHPTIEALAARIETTRDTGEADLPPIARIPRGGDLEGGLPLTFAQERVWFLNQLAPGAIAYNFQFTIRFTGSLDPEALRRTLGEIVRRHEVLRTSFPAVDGRPVQVVHPPFVAELPRVDLTALPPEVREACAEAWVHREIRRGFDISRIPLLRWTLFVLGPEDHLFLQVEHHFVHDGWSLAVYLREMVAIYTAFQAGRPSPLPEPPVQYADFAAWQRGWMQGEVLRRQLAYWLERLGGSPPPLALPADRPRPRTHSFRGDCLRVDLPGPLYQELRAFARREGSTLFISMLAAFYALLYRLTGEEDLLLGSGIANRRLRETEEMVGMVVNTLVFRTAVGGGLPLWSLLDRVRTTVLEAQDHQDMPFEKLVEELQPDREASRNPLFQVLFSFHDAPVPDLDFAGLSGHLFERHNGSAKADLNVVVKPLAEQRVGRRPSGGEALTMVWESSGDIFERATIERFWGHYQTLLAGMIEGGAGRRIAELPLLTATERAQLAAWNETDAPGPAGHAHELFLGQVARAPGALAVADGRSRLTYGEVAERARELAGRLRELGVGAESVVGLLADRSAETVVGALAVLLAGGAYLPLDPAAPQERLDFLLEDSGAVAVLVKKDLKDSKDSKDSKDTLSIAPLKSLQSLKPLAPPDLAYLIYTSGSTGRPKGVEIPHAGLSHLIAWHLRTYSVGPEDRATLLAGPAFDASVWEMWPYLAAGASLHVPDAETRGTPERLLAWLAAERITLAFLPTPLAEAVLDITPPPGLALRVLLTGGDRLRRVPPPDLPFVLVNHYGPTENTVVTTAAPVGPGSPVPPPIGRPIAGTRAWIADRDLRRVPVGVPGELLAAGAGLARGYRGRPDLTAERFIPDPWSPEPGGRLYRTGDVARWRAGGQIEFLGRRDHQVKIRGYRIELGEIEAVLAEHPAVREAVVVLRDVLVAYVVLDQKSDLRAFLATKLPDYMVPTIFVELAALPLTPNGKIDLRALPAPELEREEARSAAPGSPVEELLAGIWAETLGLGAVGLHDDFFKLGGHSLIATRLLSRVRDAVGAEVPLAALFEGPTVAQLARVVEAGLGGVSAGERIPRRSGSGPAPLSFAQERLWFLDQLAPGGSVYNIARAFRLRGPLDPDALERAAAGLLARHEALRTSFPDQEGRPVQEIAPDLALSIPRLDATEEEAGRWISAAARQPFDLRRGSLLRLALLRLGPDDHLLFLAMHHIVSDGWSMRLVFRDLAELYRGATLPALPVQVPDFAVWQRDRLQGETLAGLLAYWQGQLAGAPARLELPADRPRPPFPSFRGFQEEIPLPASAAAQLRELARQSAATPFILLVAALSAFFARLTGQSDIVLGSPIAGRTRSEVEELIGFFVNTLVLRLRWDGDPAGRELLAEARRVLLGAHAHQELPFEKVVAELTPERNLSHAPLFQVMLSWQEAARETFELPGLEVAPVAVRRDESRFDLELTARDEPGGGLALLWRYDSDLFDRTTVLRLARGFETLLGALLADPGRRLSALPLLGAAETHQLLVEWNDTGSGAPRDLTIPELFAEQVRARPHELAVVAPDERLTYGELDERGERLARRLRGLGVGPDVRVGLCLNRSLPAVVAILGILKAGGAYVPLDPAYPRERLAFMLEDAKAPVLLTLAEHVPGLPETPGCQIVLLDQEEESEATAMGLLPRTSPANLAYVMYTSGSTGTPKGVAVSHRAVVRLVRGSNFTALSADETWLQLAPIAFDASTLEIWGSLLNGGRLVIFPGYTPALEELGAFIEREGITSLWLTAGLFHPMVEGALESFRGVRHLLAGGDVLAPAQVEKVLARFPDLTLVNGYGPTENTTFTCCHSLRGPQRLAGSVPIGRPVAATRAVLLDRGFQPVSLGAAGELCAGGDGLARGYLDRPELTAERFVPDPTGAEPGGRLYRTGDLARHLPDGRLEFLGRLDQQVKVRGFRIELGEVEAAVAAYPGVRAAVVAARDDGPGSKRLAAYLVLEEAGGEIPAGLRDFLRERLPDYMVPSDFVALDALPLGPTGKVDRRALPAPDASRRAPEETFVPPESIEEVALAAIWSEVLVVDRIGVKDDFFALGGHSLLAAQVVSRVRRDFQVDLPLRSLFQEPTIAGLLAAIGQARASGGPAHAPRIARVSRTASLRPRPPAGDRERP